MPAFPIFGLFAEMLEMRKKHKNAKTKNVKNVSKSKWISLKLEPHKMHLKRDVAITLQ